MVGLEMLKLSLRTSMFLLPGLYIEKRLFHFEVYLCYFSVWYVIIYYHGDLDPDHLPDKQSEETESLLLLQNFINFFI
jgi:hypothetical protein